MSRQKTHLLLKSRKSLTGLMIILIGPAALPESGRPGHYFPESRIAGITK
jgi:hypothetical protein